MGTISSSKAVRFTTSESRPVAGLFRISAKARRFGFKDQSRAAAYEFARNLQGLRDVRENFPVELPSIRAGQQQYTSIVRTIANDKGRRSAAANAADRTIPMYLSIAGIHYTQVALAIDDFSS